MSIDRPAPSLICSAVHILEIETVAFAAEPLLGNRIKEVRPNGQNE